MRKDGVLDTSVGQLIGQILKGKGLVDDEQLRSALDQQKRSGEMLLEVLLKRGVLSEEGLASALALQSGLPFRSLSECRVGTDLYDLVPEAFARKHKVTPLALEVTTLTVAIANPFDVMAVDELRRLTGRTIKLVVATEREIMEAINRAYRGDGAAERLKAKSTMRSSASDGSGRSAGETTSSDSPFSGGEEEPQAEGSVSQTVDGILERAVHRRATDIHLEPEENLVRVRFRIDGILHEDSTYPKALQSALTTRVKIMSVMSITENRLPQDGRAQWIYGNRKVDLRVSTFPTVWGETIAIRILDRDTLVLGLERLGLPAEQLTLLKQMSAKPHGIILVTGPTGSGKTTTLYSILGQLNTRQKNILTIEDPVEYELPMIRQSQINLKAGLTFATGLRAILRQDPDVIFVGEIRDAETAEIAIRSALTGHLVFSTLHTNDAIGAIPRMRDMGVEPYLVASSLIGVIAQRLVRVICAACKKSVPASPVLMQFLRARGMTVETEECQAMAFLGRGCSRCHGTGFSGRIAIFEILAVNEQVRQLISERADESVLVACARKNGMRPMFDDGLDKVLQGVTTLEEVLQTTQAERSHA